MPTQVNTNQHDSTRINTTPTRINTIPTRINTSPTRVNTNQHESDTNQHIKSHESKYLPKNDLADYRMPLTLLCSEGYHKYLALKYLVFNILKSIVHNWLSQLSEQSILQLSLYYTKCLIDGNLSRWVSKFRGKRGRPPLS